MNALPTLLLGSILLGTGLVLSRRSDGSLGSLGDEVPAIPSSFDPSRSNRAAYLRTHAAKKFWGATILTAQAAVSMDKFAARIRSANPEAAGEAAGMSREFREAATRAGSFALKYDEPWVRNRMKRSGINFEIEPEKAA